MMAKLLATLAATTITESYDDLQPETMAAKEIDLLAMEIRPNVVDVSTADENQRRLFDKALIYQRWKYLPTGLQNRVTGLFHDNPESCHLRVLQTAKVEWRHIYWPAIESEIWICIGGCKFCHRIKAPHHACYGPNMPLSLPSRPWKGHIMDLVSHFPESTAAGYTGILVIVDRLTKIAIYLPCRKVINSPELARMLFEHVIFNRGVPDTIFTTHSNEFISLFWDRVCSHLTINHRLSTAFHWQTDGHTKQQNQTMEQYLPASCNHEQDNWFELLLLA
jgi:hypothetical protein